MTVSKTTLALATAAFLVSSPFAFAQTGAADSATPGAIDGASAGAPSAKSPTMMTTGRSESAMKPGGTAAHPNHTDPKNGATGDVDGGVR